jgi:hypothetical protein
MIDSDAAKNILDDTVYALGLLVCLGVIGSGQRQICAEQAKEFVPKGSGETRVPV